MSNRNTTNSKKPTSQERRILKATNFIAQRGHLLADPPTLSRTTTYRTILPIDIYLAAEGEPSSFETGGPSVNARFICGMEWKSGTTKYGYCNASQLYTAWKVFSRVFPATQDGVQMCVKKFSAWGSYLPDNTDQLLCILYTPPPPGASTALTDVGSCKSRPMCSMTMPSDHWLDVKDTEGEGLLGVNPSLDDPIFPATGLTSTGQLLQYGEAHITVAVKVTRY